MAYIGSRHSFLSGLTPLRLQAQSHRLWHYTQTPYRLQIIASSGHGKKHRTGLDNRLAPNGNPQPTPIGGGSSSRHKVTSNDDNSSRSWFQPICNTFQDFIGKALYKYYNWRQDTLSDLQLFMVINTVVIVLGAGLRRYILASGAAFTDGAEGAQVLDPSIPAWWHDLYSVLVVILGQELPEQSASAFPQQVFAVATAVLGLASFALVLALTEQVALEVLEGNVRRGSKVYEKGHNVILAWGESARDLSQVATMLRQICAAAAPRGGTTIAVLAAHREKLELEELSREAIPFEERKGTQIVFRQGSPLDPGALRMVSVTDARTVIISGDYSRPVEDSDAQVLRAAVLIDEMAAAEGKEWIQGTPMINGNAALSQNLSEMMAAASTHTANAPPMGPWVVAELQGMNAPALIRYACSDRIIPVPINTINAKRYARLLKHPVVATLSHSLFDHTLPGHAFLGSFPEAGHLIGVPFGNLHAYFPNAIVVGLIDMASGQCALNPSPERKLQRGEALVMLRSAVSASPLRPLAMPMAGYNAGTTWDPSKYSQRSIDEAPLGINADSTACLWSIVSSTAAATKSTEQSLLEAAIGPRAAPPTAATMCQQQQQVSAALDGNGTGKMNWLKKGLGSRRNGMEIRRLAASMLPLSFGSAAMGAATGTDLLLCGWSGHNAMRAMLQEFEQGAEALPAGSQIVMINAHNTEDVLRCCRVDEFRNVNVRHVRCDPRDRESLAAAIDVRTLRAAVVLFDTKWAQKSYSDSSPYSLSQTDMLRMDAAVLEVQLNIRYLLEKAGCPDINIIAEKLTYLGQTRFEAREALPLGAAVNSASYVAKVLAQISEQPRTLAAYSQLGVQCEIVVKDASEFAAVGEKLSFLAMQARCASVNQVLMGWYAVPTADSMVLEITVNPQGQEERMAPMVWNQGDCRCKLITLAPKKSHSGAGGEGTAAAAVEADSSSSSSIEAVLVNGSNGTGVQSSLSDMTDKSTDISADGSITGSIESSSAEFSTGNDSIDRKL